MAALVIVASILAGTIHVPGEETSIQAAIDRAGDGDDVVVAAGEYAITEPITFRGKAITLRAADGAAATTIRMTQALDPLRASVVVFESGETDAAVLEGFTLTGGRGSRWGNGSTEGGGGGVLARNGSRPVVKSCTITGNSGRNGGGVMCDVGASVTVDACTLVRNSAGGFGGGILWLSPSGNPVLRGSTVEQNVASSGGALFCYQGASPEITDCVLRGNLAFSVAGGLCCLIDSAPTVSSTIFIGNYASGAGALSCETDTDSPVVTNCLMIGNSAFSGGAVQARDGAAPTLVNCTIASNLASDLDGGVTCPGGEPVIVNSIVARNVPPSVCGSVSFSITAEGSLFEAEGEFDFEAFRAIEINGSSLDMPDFVIDAGDYHLKAGSAAIDSGTASGAPATDIEGTARACGDGIDCGAYERCAASHVVPFRRGYANGDSRSDLSDAVFTLDYLFVGNAVPTCKKSLDFDDSGTLNVSDGIYLLGFLFRGGPPPPPPTASCGDDPTEDGLTCDSSAACGG
jgi:hypothetical protein